MGGNEEINEGNVPKRKKSRVRPSNRGGGIEPNECNERTREARDLQSGTSKGQQCRGNGVSSGKTDADKRIRPQRRDTRN